MKDIKYICALEKDFPERLKNIPDSPGGIYFRGRLPDPKKPSVAIIGSRNNSEYGRGAAREFAAFLSKKGVQIISGMARGIDGIAQRAALDAGGVSFGVLGCGVDIVYPKENRDLFERITEKGGIISEYSPGMPPKKELFPPRNRIISAFCDILLVIEARERSGTSITVRHALEQGRDIFAVPGRITDPLSRGCNILISEGAGVALSPETVLEALNSGSFTGVYENSLTRSPVLKGIQAEIMGYLDYMPLNINDLALKTSLPVREIMAVLLELEIKGLARKVSPGYYVKVF